MPPSEWQIGKSKVFLRGLVHEPLEDRRMAILTNKATIIQKVWKGQRKRKEYQRLRRATVKIQESYLAWRSRIRFLRQRRAAIVIQAHLRGMFAREVAAALREAKRVEEERRRKEMLEEERRRRKEKELQEERASNEHEEEVVQTIIGDPASMVFDRKKSFGGLADLDQGSVTHADLFRTIRHQVTLKKKHCYLIRDAEKELMQLSQLAGQLNPKLVDGLGGAGGSDGVDLDQLFNFLSGEVRRARTASQYPFAQGRLLLR